MDRKKASQELPTISIKPAREGVNQGALLVPWRTKYKSTNACDQWHESFIVLNNSFTKRK